MRSLRTVEISLTRLIAAVLAVLAAVGLVVALLVRASHPPTAATSPSPTSTSLPPATVLPPPGAMDTLQVAGTELFEVRPADQLTIPLYWERFLERYPSLEEVLRTRGDATLNPQFVGRPIVLWFAEGFMDVALRAQTPEGYHHQELRIADLGGSWKVTLALAGGKITGRGEPGERDWPPRDLESRSHWQ